MINYNYIKIKWIQMHKLLSFKVMKYQDYNKKQNKSKLNQKISNQISIPYKNNQKIRKI